MSETNPACQALKWRERERFAVEMADIYLAKIEELIARNAELSHKLSNALKQLREGANDE